jgi:surface antigen
MSDGSATPNARTVMTAYTVLSAMRSAAVGLALFSLVALSWCVGATKPASASDSPSTVCQGYVECNRGAFTTHDYQDHVNTSYWNMYAGNNCTNYVAFVESSVYGVAAPTYRLGDAGQWPTTAALHGALVDHTPTIGSVAEWDGGSPGIPSPGHVGVVEEVGPHDSYIVISQQNISDVNDYGWTRINADGQGNQWEQWPSNFIHFSSDQGALRDDAFARTVWVDVQVRPARFRTTRFVLNNGTRHVVAPGRVSSFAPGAGTGGYGISFERPSLQKRYSIVVSARGPGIRILHQGGPYTTTRPRIGIIDSRSVPEPVVITLTIRPGRPAPAVAASPTTTSTSTLPATTTTDP